MLSAQWPYPSAPAPSTKIPDTMDSMWHLMWSGKHPLSLKDCLLANVSDLSAGWREMVSSCQPGNQALKTQEFEMCPESPAERWRGFNSDRQTACASWDADVKNGETCAYKVLHKLNWPAALVQLTPSHIVHWVLGIHAMLFGYKWDGKRSEFLTLHRL